MTGDGVNDVLAMKESDCSIAVAQGTEAARAVADIVLLDSSFESVPKIVDEGRMAINNLQRSASLFIVKTIYSMLITLFTLRTRFPYPFIPFQLTLISALSIGLPSFFLAFQPNKDIVQGNFIKNILMKAAPTGITIAIGFLAVNIVSIFQHLPPHETSTISLVLTGSMALLGVLFISMPLDSLRLVLVAALSGAFVMTLLFFNNRLKLTT
jgi:cation-transporting ATPase E